MGNLIITNDLISVADAEITARSTAAGFEKKAVMDFWHLKRRHRADDLVKSDVNPLFRLDMGAAMTVAAILLNDINYDKVRIRGHATDLNNDWTASTFDSGDVTVSQNAWTGRYQAFIPLTAFDLRWIAVCTPAAASAVGSYLTKWETGTVVLLDSATALTVNMSYGFQEWADDGYDEVTFPGGGLERVNLRDEMRWYCQCPFGARTPTDETELKTLNRYHRAEPLVWYRNNSDTSEAYLCVRDDPYKSETQALNIVNGNTLSFKELI